MVGGERFNQRAATHSHARLVKGVIDLFALPAQVYQPGCTQDAEMVRDGGLRDVEGIDYLPNAYPTTAAQAHNLLASIVCQGFSESY